MNQSLSKIVTCLSIVIATNILQKKPYMSPSISLIIPVYNSKTYLRRCLDSVQAQTFTDYEVVLVDDGSTDGSSDICDAYAAMDSRFRVFHEANRGSSLARKFGMEHALGQWYVFMDSDDDVHPHYLSRLYEAVVEKEAEIAICEMQQVDNDASPVAEKPREAVMLDSEQLHERFFHYSFWGFWGKIYYRDVFDGLYFPPYNINEDYVVMAQLFLRQKQVAYVPNALYYYRTNMLSQSHLRLTPRIMDEYHNKLWVVEFYNRFSASAYYGRSRSQLVETCVKLLGVIREEDVEGRYYKEQRELKKCLVKDVPFLLFRSRLPIALRIVGVMRAMGVL